MICHIALRNLATGQLVGLMDVPDWDMDDPNADPIQAAFDAHLLPVKPHQQAGDGSCGTFTWGPLMGLWEWLDFGEEPSDRDDKWANAVYRGILEDQA